jgi:hypothetical protein
MRFVFGFAIALSVSMAAVLPARAAFIAADVNVSVTPDGGTTDILAFEVFGSVSSEPDGAEFLQIVGTFDTSVPASPSLDSGGIVVTDLLGSNYLTGTMTAGAFDFEDPLSADSMSFSFTPTSGTAAYAFSPAFVADIDGLQLVADGSGGFGGTGSVAVSQVPVPATLPLLASGLGAVALWVRRSSRRAADTRNAGAS